MNGQNKKRNDNEIRGIANEKRSVFRTVENTI